MKIEGMSTEANVSVMIDELETQRNQMRYVGAVLRLMDAVRGQDRLNMSRRSTTPTRCYG